MQQQGPWGNPQPPQWPPQPQGWVPADVGLQHSMKKLDDELQTWLILCAVGWFSGLFIIVGPVAIWKAADLRAKYESLRAPVPGNVGALRLVGILTCIFCALLIVAVVSMLIFAVVVASRTH